jgi:hypothetical protein
LLDRCYPNKNLQERELGAVCFLARHGLALLDRVYDVIEPGRFGHALLRLN